MRGLHEQILAGDDAALLLDEPASATAGCPAPAVPRELPSEARHFTGRTQELKELTRLLDPDLRGTPQAVVISAIGGAAGVGKTALAVHWAHQVAHHFADGQLYVDLRGYDPGLPMSAADALARFLRALGVPIQDIPAEVDERAARYRSLLAGRRLLIVLDNAGSADQVRPLLPGTPGCVAVVTSRSALTGLIARDGAERLELDVLTMPDAVGLLRSLIGSRVDADPLAAQALAAQCSRLPLALRVAAELTAARPDASLAWLVDELADQKRKLDLLDAGEDCRSSVRDVFSWSYQHLDTAAAQAFRLLALPPGPEYDQYAVAALTGTTKERASRALAVLARAHLIYATAPGRYGMHDLLRAYADELTTAVDGEDERRSALTRLFDHYLHTAAAAIDSLFPAETRRPQVPVSASPAPCVTDPAAARAWLDAQRANLVAVCVHAAASGWPGHATDLSATLARYLDNGGHFPEAVTIHTHARDIARRTGDRAAEAAALSNLGPTAWWQGRYQQAADHLQDALALHRQVGDAIGEARALSNLGMVDDQQGRYESAASFYRRSLALSRQAGDRNSEAYALANLGVIERRLDHPGTAARYIQQGLFLFRQGGNRSAQSSALAALGDVELQQGHPGQAADHYQQSIALCRELGDLAGETTALNGLGEAFRMAERPGDARAQHAAALALAAQIGHKHEQARAHDGLASSYAASGDIDRSRSHWREALTLYVGLGAPEADQVRTRLARAAAPLTRARE